MVLIILLALAGVVLISLEVILPGMILGLAGGAAIISSLAMTFASEELASLSFGGRALVAACLLLGCLLLIGLWLKYFDRTALGSKLVLGPSSDAKVVDTAPKQLLGVSGTALTDLRPSGKVRVEGLPKSCDIVAESGFIEAGSAIEVVKVEGRRVVVRATS